MAVEVEDPASLLVPSKTAQKSLLTPFFLKVPKARAERETLSIDVVAEAKIDVFATWKGE